MGYVVMLQQVATSRVEGSLGYLVSREIKQIKTRVKRFLVTKEPSSALVFPTQLDADNFAWTTFKRSRVVSQYWIYEKDTGQCVAHSYCKWKV